MKQTNSNSQSKGFTLVELVVVVMIVGLVATISIANFRNGEKQKSVRIAADTVIAAIREAQNLALAGKNTKDPNPACQKASAYFIDIIESSRTLELYVVTNCGVSTPIQEYRIPPSTRVKAGSLMINGTNADTSIDVRFTTPYAAVTVNGNVTATRTFTSVTITLESTDGTVAQTVTVDGLSGRIGE